MIKLIKKLVRVIKERNKPVSLTEVYLDKFYWRNSK